MAIGPVTGRVLQSYRSGSHVKLKFRSTCTVLQAITMQSSDKNIFVYSNPFLLSYIIEIHGATKVEKFLHVQNLMITAVGQLVVIYPFQETKLVGYLLYSTW